MPGVIVMGLSSNTHFAGRVDSRDDESPNYRIESSRKWPDQNLGITFIPGAENESLGHAFHLQFDCLWSLVGCRKITDIAPEATQDRQRFWRAAYERLTSPEPCPDRLIPRRVRDRDDILLLEVTRAGPSLIDPYSNDNYKMADFQTIQVFKGHSGIILSNVRVDQPQWGAERIQNPAFELIKPGRRIILFSGYDNSLNEACEAIAATPTAVQTLTAALKN
ncbi:MAG TPA: hypothetical protein VLK33_02600 [Terriglobales bacterium]|nr:hypothetical protein [Terriglobales bacterium]